MYMYVPVRCSLHCCVVSLDKKLFSTLSLFTKVYKIMGTGNILLWVMLQWINIPSKGSSNTPSYFMLQKLG